jgi:peptidoglycan/xylan/chitin deacetylase (PgdA/CDA1 family)
LWSATREGFDEQVRWLSSNFDVISPRDIPAVTRGRHVMITFDDGYSDNYTQAFPVLKSRGVPATFFVATGFIDEPELLWWDEIAWMVRTSKHSTLRLPDYVSAPLVLDEPHREQTVRTLLRAYKKLPSEFTAAYLDAVGVATGAGRAPRDSAELRAHWMTWDMLREMYAAGMTIGGHTAYHPVLARLSREEQMTEISTCHRRITEELGVPMNVFAYPVGSRDSSNAATRECLRRVGVKLAFSYYGGYRRLTGGDDFDIPRIGIEQEMTLTDFKAAVMFPWIQP